MAIDMALAKRLKVYRNFKHLTQKEVASYLNVPHSAISDIENGKRDITVGELKILSGIFMDVALKKLLVVKSTTIITLQILLVYYQNFLIKI